MNWQYFDLIPLEGTDIFKLVDEDGQDFTEDSSLVYFASHEEAEGYLVANNIRGSVR